MAGKKFDDMMKRLEEIVQDLEGGELSLEDSLKIFEEGMGLIRNCSRKLEEVEQKVTMLVKDSGGGYVEQPLEPDEKDEV
ncbi:MAG: exodeoxyribonuclease VII small subunit [Deltaproteobacteria bacterium]|nr:exodeoxyribonuclease VII small subunit [Deltaproteobacteria bacterium]